eukprot:357719-Chlamydomonas_euryale.AAC.1
MQQYRRRAPAHNHATPGTQCKPLPPARVRDGPGTQCNSPTRPHPHPPTNPTLTSPPIPSPSVLLPT